MRVSFSLNYLLQCDMALCAESRVASRSVPNTFDVGCESISNFTREFTDARRAFIGAAFDCFPLTYSLPSNYAAFVEEFAKGEDKDK